MGVIVDEYYSFVLLVFLIVHRDDFLCQLRDILVSFFGPLCSSVCSYRIDGAILFRFRATLYSISVRCVFEHKV